MSGPRLYFRCLVANRASLLAVVLLLVGSVLLATGNVVDGLTILWMGGCTFGATLFGLSTYERYLIYAQYLEHDAANKMPEARHYCHKVALRLALADARHD